MTHSELTNLYLFALAIAKLSVTTGFLPFVIVALVAERLYVYRGDRMDRKGQMCRVLVRGKRNSALVEFADGHRAVTSRNALRVAAKEELSMNSSAKNALTQAALGIARIEFKHYRAGNAHWLVVMENGEEFGVVTHSLGTESTVLRLAAEKLAKSGRAVSYPKGAA